MALVRPLGVREVWAARSLIRSRPPGERARRMSTSNHGALAPAIHVSDGSSARLIPLADSKTRPTIVIGSAGVLPDVPQEVPGAGACAMWAV